MSVEFILQARGLSFSYQEGERILEDVNVDIGRGEQIAVLGANGAGKSTFFLCLNGFKT